MERVFLCLLCLSGWSVSSCLSRQYHYVADPKTWTEAQTYCRQTYTDLATANSTQEMNQLLSLVPNYQSSSYVWIGLYSKVQWKWSDGYNGSESDYVNWEKGEPDFESSDEFCGQIDEVGQWWDYGCLTMWPSLCYSGTQEDPDFFFVSEKMTWSSAQSYCRENYVDLATLTSNAKTQKTLNLLPYGSYTWIGLYRDPLFFWSDGSGYSFQFWKEGKNLLGTGSVVCGAANLELSGKWKLRSCEEKHPFVCYSTSSEPTTEPTIEPTTEPALLLATEQATEEVVIEEVVIEEVVIEQGMKKVIKLKMKPDDPSLDLNDPAVKASILRQLQDRLEQSGLSGVTLKWREQPDGKVFYKEGGSSEELNKEKCEAEL